METKIYKENPNGSIESTNTFIEYKVDYNKSWGGYVLSALPCAKSDIGVCFDCMALMTRHSAMLLRCTRRADKRLIGCACWLSVRVDDLHKAYLAGGLNSVRTYIENNPINI